MPFQCRRNQSAYLINKLRRVCQQYSTCYEAITESALRYKIVSLFTFLYIHWLTTTIKNKELFHGDRKLKYFSHLHFCHLIFFIILYFYLITNSFSTELQSQISFSTYKWIILFAILSWYHRIRMLSDFEGITFCTFISSSTIHLGMPLDNHKAKGTL